MQRGIPGIFTSWTVRRRNAPALAGDSALCTMYKIINKKKLAATVALDLVGRALFLPARLFRRSHKIQADQVRTILVIRTAYIGDVVMTLPVLKPLRELFPGARISFLTATGAAEVLKNNPFVDEVIAYDPFWFYPSSMRAYGKFIRQMRTRAFDLVIEARADIRDLLLLAWPLKARYRLSYDVGGGGYLLTHVVPYPGLKHKVEYHLDLVRYLGYRGNGLEWGIYLSDSGAAAGQRDHGGAGHRTAVYRGPSRQQAVAQAVACAAVRRAVRRTDGEIRHARGRVRRGE